MWEAVIEAWAWLVPAFVIGAAGGWLGRMRYDKVREQELIAEVHQDEDRIHELEDELDVYHSLSDVNGSPNRS